VGRPRKPTELHLLTVSFDKNPSRAVERANEPHDERPLGGGAPEFLRPDQRVTWMEIERLAPWLAYCDRLAVEIAAVLLARFRLDPGSMAPALYTRLETILGRLGLTPSDRSRVTVPNRPRRNEFSNNGRRP
jgi:hypothetical protein